MKYKKQFFFPLVVVSLLAQSHTVPVNPVSKTKPSVVINKDIVGDGIPGKMDIRPWTEKATLKISSDVDAKVYVDGILVAGVKEDVIYALVLDKGIYLIKVVSERFTDIFAVKDGYKAEPGQRDYWNVSLLDDEFDHMGKQLVSLVKDCMVDSSTDKSYTVEEIGFDEVRRDNTLSYDSGKIQYSRKEICFNTSKNSISGTISSATYFKPSGIAYIKFGEDPERSEARGSSFYVTINGMQHFVKSNSFDSDDDEDSEEHGVCPIPIKKECVAALKEKVNQLFKDRIPVE